MKKGMKRMLSLAVAVFVLVTSTPMSSLSVQASQSPDNQEIDCTIENFKSSGRDGWNNQTVTLSGEVQGNAGTNAYVVRYSTSKDAYSKDKYNQATGGTIDIPVTDPSGMKTFSFDVSLESNKTELQKTYYIWAYDSQKHKSAVMTKEVKIETVKPEVTTLLNDSIDPITGYPKLTGKDVTISGQVADKGSSGIKMVCYGKTEAQYNADTLETRAKDVTEVSVDWKGNYSFILNETYTGDIYVWTYDNAGNKSEHEVTKVDIDKTPPIINGITDNTGGSWKNGQTGEASTKWTKEAVTLTVDALLKDDSNLHHAVKKIYYGTSKNIATTEEIELVDALNGQVSITIPTDDNGVNTTYYIWAENGIEGKTTDPIPYKVQIDAHTPEIKSYDINVINDGSVAKFFNWISGGIFCNEGVEVTVTATDEGSKSDKKVSAGMESITLNGLDIDDNTIKEEIGTVKGDDLETFEKDGVNYVKATFTIKGTKGKSYKKTLSATATDKMGHTSSETKPGDLQSGMGSDLIMEDIPPVIEIKQNENSHYKELEDGNVFYNGEASFNVEVSDLDAGIKWIEITVNGEKIIADADNKTILTKDMTKVSGPVDKVSYIINTGDIEAEDGQYQIAVKVMDYSNNDNSQSSMAYQDITAPEITKMTFASKEAELKEKTDIIKTNYGYFFKNNTTVTIEAKDNEKGCGVEAICYYTVDKNGNKSAEQTVTPDKMDQIHFTIEAGFKGYIYVYAKDKVGNQCKVKHPDAVIVETLEMHSKDASLTMDIKNTTTKKDANGLDLYAGAVNVDCAFADTISGLSNITYQVKDGTTGELLGEGSVSVNGEGDLVDNTVGFEVKSKDQNLVTKVSKSISVADDHNNIKVSAILTDRAGYKTSQEVNFSIDTTAPTIEVTYDNNSYDKDFANETQYYKEGRTATITVTERNFKEEDLDITAANSDGAAPTISGWTKHENSDPNQTTYTATVDYTKEGDYTFGMGFTDLAGNQAASVATQKFTVDTTVPTVQVTYDNNQAQTETFYKEGRTATITINEHNFETSRIKSVLTAKDGGAAPAISSFSSNGDIHTATISFTDDQVYTFDMDYTDKAGHQAADLQEITFCVDKTMPVLTVTGIKNYSANSGRDAGTREETNVGFVVEASDTNFAGLTLHLSLVTLEGTQNCDDLLGGAQGFANGQRYAVTNLKKDGIYILTASVTDKAGNENKAARVTGADGTVIEAEQIVFSVNRNGSVYTLGEDTQKINGSYLTQEQDIVIRETNVNALTQRKLTLFKDNQTMILEEGKDFKIDKTEGNGQWNQYTYTIFKQNFVNDGYYSLAVYSVDAANNESENNLDTKDMELRFAIDKTAPKVIVTDLADKETYKAAKKDVTMVIDDNMKLEEVKVYHATYDGDQSEAEYGEATTTWNTDQIQEMVANNQDFNFSIDGNTAEKHKVKIVAVDAAGTEKEVEVKDFYITEKMVLGAQITNMAKKNPLPLVAGILVVLGGIGVGVVFMLRRKKTTAE